MKHASYVVLGITYFDFQMPFTNFLKYSIDTMIYSVEFYQNYNVLQS